MIDRSGWNLLVEDVTPVDGGGLADSIQSLWKGMGRLLGDEMTISERPKSSRFVEEMRRKLSHLPLTPIDVNQDVKQFPTLNIRMAMPQSPSDPKLETLVTALNRGLQSRSIIPVDVSVSQNAVHPIISCDDYAPQINRHRIQMTQLIILVGCSIHDDKEMAIEISRDAPVFVVRTMYPSLNDEAQNKLALLLENDIAAIIAHEITRNLVTTPYQQKISSLSIELIDEDPSSRSGDDKSRGKAVFEALGQAFASSVIVLIQPMLNDLSFLYGRGDFVESFTEKNFGYLGNIVRREQDSIKLSTSVSAYLPIPNEMIEINAKEEKASYRNYISTNKIADWAATRIYKQSVKDTDVQWTLFVPSQDHSPLMIHDESDKGEGSSVTFAITDTISSSSSKAHNHGLSMVNLDGCIHDSSGDIKQQCIQNATSTSLLYLTGYIRVFLGLSLSPLPGQYDKSIPRIAVKYTSPIEIHAHHVSYWEMESIAQKQWQSILHKALYETDALMSLLYIHRGLTFTDRLAHKLNNATHLLRHSISLIEQGYPTQYTTLALHGSLYHLEEVRSDPELMELPHFAIDHYLAVFSPLVLPLLMPLVVGLVREIKRYRELKKNKVVV